ncbi:MAG: ribonuclease D, partial [Rhodobacteraceae bacterium]|nr:ribonuclease D [Paracoccaceae bacterium]
SGADLDAIAGEEAPDVPALRGWRFELFGRDALRLKAGEIALSADGARVRVVDLDREVAASA